jgi:hypothetical protein
MSLYGTDYFIDNTGALEEAFNNELNNFNLMMESFNNIEVVNEGVIKDKIKELWDKFKQWIKSLKDKIKKVVNEKILKNIINQAHKNIDNDNLSGKVPWVVIDNEDKYQTVDDLKIDQTIELSIRKYEDLCNEITTKVLKWIEFDNYNGIKDKSANYITKDIDEYLNYLKKFKQNNYPLKFDLSNKTGRVMVYSIADNYYNSLAKIRKHIDKLDNTIKIVDKIIVKEEKMLASDEIETEKVKYLKDTISTRTEYIRVLKNFANIEYDMYVRVFKLSMFYANKLATNSNPYEYREITI